MRNIICSFCLCCLLTAPVPSEACSIAHTPQVRFNSKEFVFQGQVVGFVIDSLRSVVEFASQPDTLYYHPIGGLVIEPTEVVHLPHRAEVYTVFPSSLGGACEDVYWTIEAIQNYYSLGDSVAVIAWEDISKHRIRRSKENMWLHANYTGMIAKTLISFDPWVASLEPSDEIAGFFEQRDNHSKAFRRASSIEERRVLSPLGEALGARLEYEYKRDLARLEATGSSEERIRILFKINLYRGTDSWTFDHCAYSALVYNYLRREGDRGVLGVHLMGNDRALLATRSTCRALERIREEERKRVQKQG